MMCLHVSSVSYMLLKYNIFNVAFPGVMPFIPRSKDHGLSGWNFIKKIMGALMDNIKLAVIQLQINVNNVEENISRAEDKIKEYAEKGADIICLPEAFATTINIRYINEQAEEIPGGKIFNRLCICAKENNVFIAAGIVEQEGGIFYSTTVLIDSNGKLAGKYQRKSVYPLERPFLGSGKNTVVINTSLGRIGLLSGNDINFPGITQTMFKEKAEIIICTALIPSWCSETVNKLVQARAIENGCYFILASGCGSNTIAGLEFMGGSMAVRSCMGFNPLNLKYVSRENIMERCGKSEDSFMVVLDMKQIRLEIEENPHYKTLYGSKGFAEVQLWQR